MKIISAVDLYARDQFKKDMINSIPAQDERRFILYGLTCNKNDENDGESKGYTIEVAFKRFNNDDNPVIMLINSIGKTLNIIDRTSEDDRGIPNNADTLLPAVMMLIKRIVAFKKMTNNISDLILYTIVNKDDITVGGRYINANDDILSIVCDELNSNKIKDVC